MTGSRGFVGSALVPFLREKGYEVIRLVHTRAHLEPDMLYWDPQTGSVANASFEGFDAVIHLAGESIAGGLWTKRKKERIFLSRCRDTWLLSQILTRLSKPPKTVICASAIGFYGNRGVERLTERSSPGSGFLADTCVKWEAATESLTHQSIRVVHARFGMVLAPQGGMLKRLALPIRWGLGCYFGKGDQIVSWITRDDLLGILYHILERVDLSGAVNCVAPQTLTQKEFTQTCAKHLHRKAFLSFPAPLAHLFFGQMAEELLLASQNVVPERLLKSGYVFLSPTLDAALSRAFGSRGNIPKF